MSTGSERDGRNGSVSIALCTHNGEQFVVDQLESIFAQTELPDQIVISDDASTDRTVELVSESIARLNVGERAVSDVSVFAHSEAVGVTANFQRAIMACSGSVILLSDQDDRWMPDRIERTVREFTSRHELLLLHGDAKLVDETGKDLGDSLFEALEIDASTISRIHAGGAFDLLLQRNLVTGATTAFRSTVAATAMPFPLAWVHDEWLAIVASAVGIVDVLESQLIEYRQHGANQIGVRKIGVLGKFRRMREPGAQRNARLLARATELEQRFVEMADEVGSDKVELVKAKLVHETARSTLPTNRIRRLPGVLAELRSGRYRTFGRGVADAARDLIQPHSAAR